MKSYLIRLCNMHVYLDALEIWNLMSYFYAIALGLKISFLKKFKTLLMGSNFRAPCVLLWGCASLTEFLSCFYHNLKILNLFFHASPGKFLVRQPYIKLSQNFIVRMTFDSKFNTYWMIDLCLDWRTKIHNTRHVWKYTKKNNLNREKSYTLRTFSRNGNTNKNMRSVL